jgi:hypothetical protein
MFAACMTALLAGPASAGIIEGPDVAVNPFSQFDISVDGLFWGNGEWSDVAPVGHLSTPNANEFSTAVVDPADANILTYAALTSGVGTLGASGPSGLYLMYDIHVQDDLATIHKSY